MAKLYGEIAKSALLTLDKSFSRALGQPLDASEVYYSLDAAEAYAKTSAAYIGQKIVVIENGTVTHYSVEDAAGTLKEVGARYDDTALRKLIEDLDTKIGELPEKYNDEQVQDVIDYINKKTAGIATDAALGELQNAVDGLEETVGAPRVPNGEDGTGGKEPSGLYKVIEEAVAAEATLRDEADKAILEAVSKLNHFTTKIVTSTADVKEEGVLYLIKDETVVGVDKYNEYLFVDGAAVLIGDTTTDLSDYYNKTEVDNLVQGAKDYAAGLDDADTTYTISTGTTDTKVNVTLTPDEGEAQVKEIDAYNTATIDKMLYEGSYVDKDGNTVPSVINTDKEKARLISSEEIKKIAGLVIDDSGNVGISSEVEASKVKGLTAAITSQVTGTSEGALGIEAGAEVNVIETITITDDKTKENLTPTGDNKTISIFVPTKVSDLINDDEAAHVEDVVVRSKETADGQTIYESKLAVNRPTGSNVITIDDSKLQQAINAVDNSAIKAVAVNGTPLAKDEEGQVNITATTGSANGTIAINKQDIAVKGLGSAAYMVNTDVIKSVDLSTGNANGTIHAIITNGAGSEVFNADVAVKGLGTAAYHAEGDFKTVQSEVADPTATAASGTTLSYIDSITQNANGVITPTKKTFDLAAFVKPIEDEIDALEPRVKANEDAIKIINGSDTGKSMRTVAREEANKVATAAMEFMGAVSTLPTGMTEANKGHFYKVINDIETQTETVGAGDMINAGETETYNLLTAPVQGRLYIQSYSPESPLSSYNISLTANYVDESGEYGSQTHTQEFKLEGRTSGYIEYDFSTLNFGPYSGFAPTDLKITGVGDSGSYCYIEYICLSATDPIDLDTIKSGDSIVWNGSVWYVIPSGDDIEDTWRQIKVTNGESTTTLGSSAPLALIAGNNVTLTATESGNVTIDVNVDIPEVVKATMTKNVTDDGIVYSNPIAGIILPEVNKFHVHEGKVEGISTDLLFNGDDELVLYGGNAGTGITA